MYTVVVCPECKYCWIVQDRPERTNCGRCETSHKFKSLKKFHQTENKDEAKEARSTVRANVIGDTDGFQRAKEAGNLDAEIDQAISDEQYLDEKGVDTAALDAVEARATNTGGSRSHTEIVRDGVNELSTPTEREVVEYASEYGVPPEKTETLLERLREKGSVIDTGNGLRLV